MHVRSQTSRASGSPALTGPELLIAECADRTATAFALACAEVRNASQQALPPPIRDRLSTVSRRLGALAAIQRRLEPPSTATMDLTHELGRLCQLHTEARFAELGVFVGLRAPDLTVEAHRGWVLLLIVSELLTDAARHAFAGASGRVAIQLVQHGDGVVCVVADDGIGLQGDSRAEVSGGAMVAELARLGDIHVTRCALKTGVRVELRLRSEAHL